MFFLNRFPVCFNLFVFLFLVTSCLVVAAQPCMEWIPIKKKSFEYKTKIIAPADNNTLDAEAVALLNNLSNFWRFLDLPLINREIELDLPRSKECTISEISIIPAIVGDPDANPPVQPREVIQTTGPLFQINNAKLIFQLSCCL